jgi:membrane-associated phospholipid phosphatase
MKKLSGIFKRILVIFTLFSIELLIIWLMFLGYLIVFIFITRKIFLHRENGFDERIFEMLDNWRSSFFTHYMKYITLLGSGEFVVIFALLIFLYFLFIKKHHWYSLKIPVVAIGSASLNVFLKNIFERQRPLLPHLVDAYGLSFPSGHAMISFSFYGLLIYLGWNVIDNKVIKWIVISCLFLIMHLIGFSRVYLHVHYASDVLAGFAMGILWLIFSIFVLKRIEAYSSKRTIDVPHLTKGE